MPSTANISNFNSRCCWHHHHSTTADFTPLRTPADNLLGCLSPQTLSTAHLVVLSFGWLVGWRIAARHHLLRCQRLRVGIHPFLSVSFLFLYIFLQFPYIVSVSLYCGRSWLACRLPRTYFYTYVYGRCWLALQLFRRTPITLPLVRKLSAASKCVCPLSLSLATCDLALVAQRLYFGY